jgi:hypothetical protein
LQLLLRVAWSLKSGLLQPFESVIPRLLRAELSGKRPGVDERRQTRDDGPLAFCILLSVQRRVDGGKNRMRRNLCTPPSITGKVAPRIGAPKATRVRLFRATISRVA